jgi:2-hydroxychromene-2-carboxylate isomerase
VTEARWERGENICDPGLVKELAESVGLDGGTAASAASDPDLREEGLRALVDLYDDDAFGVPYFRVGRHRFWGLDRLHGFIAEMGGTAPDEPVADLPAAGPPTAAGVPADTDTAGGCG